MILALTTLAHEKFHIVRILPGGEREREIEGERWVFQLTDFPNLDVVHEQYFDAACKISKMHSSAVWHDDPVR